MLINAEVQPDGSRGIGTDHAIAEMIGGVSIAVAIESLDSADFILKESAVVIISTESVNVKIKRNKVSDGVAKPNKGQDNGFLYLDCTDTLIALIHCIGASILMVPLSRIVVTVLLRSKRIHSMI